MTTPFTSQPEERIRYEHVEVEQERIVTIPRKEIVYQERRVPKIIPEYREKIVEVPRTQIVEKIVEVPEYIEKIKHVPVPKIVEVPREVIQYVPKVEVKVVEKEVEVQGKIIEVQKPYEVINKKIVNQYIDEEVPTVVSQTFKPHIRESTQHTQTAKLKKYVPYTVPVEVFVPVPVERQLFVGERTEELKPVEMPASQFNAQVRAANPDLSEEQLSNLYKRYPDGSIPVFRGPATTQVPPHKPVV